MKHLVTTILTLALLVSCAKHDIAPANNADGQLCTLYTRVTTQASDDFKDGVVYPIDMIVFDDKLQYVAQQSIASPDDNSSLSLAAGTYMVAMISGEHLTVSPEATTSTVIVYSSLSDTDLLTGIQEVTLTPQQDNELSIELERKVFGLQSLSITNVPAGVKDVNVSIDNLYSELSIDGGYKGSMSHNLAMTEQEPGTWVCKEPLYLLPSNGNGTFSVFMTTADQSVTKQTVVHTQPFMANHIYNIAVECDNGLQPDETARLKVVVKVDNWQGVENLLFTINSQEGTTAEPSTDAPQAGELFNGAYVLYSKPAGARTAVTLMSTGVAKKESKASEFAFGKATYDLGKSFDSQTVWQECADQMVNALTADYTAAGITGWRVPTLEEASYIAAHRTEIMEQFTTYGLSSYVGDLRYSFNMPIYVDGQYVKFSAATSTYAPFSESESNVLYMRACTTIYL